MKLELFMQPNKQLPCSRVLKRLTLVLGHSVLICLGWADVELAPLFRDGAVLQRDKPIPVWGTGTPGERLRLQFKSQDTEAVIDDNGRWTVMLAPEPASTESAEIRITGRTNNISVGNVLIGDVWLCSGQSNMEFKLAAASSGERDVALAEDPLLRHFRVPKMPASIPQSDCEGKWEVSTPTTAAGFTAVGYYFAHEWRKRTGVPVGLINSSWGGTQIESWISDKGLQGHELAGAIAARWQAWVAEYPERAKIRKAAMEKWRQERDAAALAGKPFTRREPAAPEGAGSRWEPSSLYNGMLNPLVPYALRGFLWYQGEANVARAGEYSRLLPLMIRQWREDFQQGELPFALVQLANYQSKVDKTGVQWAFLRETQSAARALPATGMAVTIDIGNPTNIHPSNKQEVGRRLALWAKSHILGDPPECNGPECAGVEIEGSLLRVRFKHAAGLRHTGPSAVGFEVAGKDRVFYPASALIDGSSVTVSASQVPNPVAVRYAWRNSPEASLFNAAGLPAGPFRSDTWQSP